MSFNWIKPFIVKEDITLNEGDKIILPASVLQQLLDLANGADLESPMTFSLRHPHQPTTLIHGGVKEFSSQDNIALLPTWMIASLGLQSTDEARVVIQWKRLPKGTWAKLRPLTNDSQNIGNYKAALEAHLRQHYNTLSIGQTITCRYGQHQYPFLVVDLQPEQAVGVNDTDLEVDLEPYQPTDLDTVSSVLQQSSSQQVQQEEVKLDQQIQNVSIDRGHYQYWSLDTANATQIFIHAKVTFGDADIVVGYDRQPTIDNYTWGNLTSDKERVFDITPSPAKTSDRRINVGIHGYSDCVISWSATLSPPSSLSSSSSQQSVPPAEEDKNGRRQCSNCQAWVPERTLPLHENFCLRNNILCPWGCGQVFKRDDSTQHWHCDQCDVIGDTLEAKTKHMDYFHARRSCDHCAEGIIVTSLPALAEHRRTVCSERLILCRYCHNLVIQGPMATDSRDRLLGLHSHESYCGSRTITCQKCNKSVTIKDVPVHAKIHEVTRQQQKLPPLCCNHQCTRPRAKNRLGFCQYCFGPFWVTEEDPKNVKLMQRMARKLHSQLTIGCGNAWCQNKYCATGSQSPQDATTAASTLIPIIQKLNIQLAMPQPQPVLHLCVDAKTTRLRFLAETLMTSCDESYGLDWCIKALESEQEDLDRAKAWLGANAPRKANKK